MKNIFFFFVSLLLSLHLSAQLIGPQEFQNDIARPNIQVLDVRTMTEYKNGHIKNSLQADWNKQDQFRERIQYVDKTRPVYVYCAAGVRSNAAAKWMRENGFTDVKELKGGINAWNAENKPTEGLPNEAQITPDAFKKMIEKDGVVFVDFGSPSCPPCVKMEPVIQSLQKNLSNKFELIRIDPTVQVNLAGHMNIDVFPTFIVYKNGKEIYKKQGISSYNELKAAILR